VRRREAEYVEDDGHGDADGRRRLGSRNWKREKREDEGAWEESLAHLAAPLGRIRAAPDYGLIGM
jgi:hypothetical protein